MSITINVTPEHLSFIIASLEEVRYSYEEDGEISLFGETVHEDELKDLILYLGSKEEEDFDYQGYETTFGSKKELESILNEYVVELSNSISDVVEVIPESKEGEDNFFDDYVYKTAVLTLERDYEISYQVELNYFNQLEK